MFSFFGPIFYFGTVKLSLALPFIFIFLAKHFIWTHSFILGQAKVSLALLFMFFLAKHFLGGWVGGWGGVGVGGWVSKYKII